MKQEVNDIAPVFYLIPTPIGNFDDITIRALKILKLVAVIFAEDTRETRKLLKEYDINKKVLAAHDFNEKQIVKKMIIYLEKGESIALVSDRGTPLVCDPGFKCVSFVINAGFTVIALPGPTAFVPALITSGIEPYPFLFFGFLNSKKGKREGQIKYLAKQKSTVIIYESPHRLKTTLNEIYQIMGERRISVAREITKKYEEVQRGFIGEIIENLDVIKGEVVIVIEGLKEEPSININEALKMVQIGVKKGEKINNVIKEVAKVTKINKNKLYQEFHKLIGE